MSYDYTPTPGTAVDSSKIGPYEQHLSKWVRNKGFGVDTREAMAQLVEYTGLSLVQIENILAKNNSLSEQVKNAISGLTTDSELINLRTAGSDLTFKTAKDRVDAVNQANFKYMSMSVHVYPTSKSDLSSSAPSFNASINRCKRLNGDYTLVPMINITSATDSAPTMMDDSVITYAISRCQENGHKILMIKPHLGVNWSDGFYRADYDPSDYGTFFANWQTILLHYAQICSDNGIPILCVGCEMLKTFGNTYIGNWKSIVDSLKAAYPDLLLTVAHNDTQDSTLTDLLGLMDFIGINWYPKWCLDAPESTDDIPSETDLMAYALKDFLDTLNEVSEKYKKPIYFTEIGIEPHLDSLQYVTSANPSGTPFYAVTAAIEKAFLNYFAEFDNVVGVSWWSAEAPFNLGDIQENDEDFALTIAENTWNDLTKKYYQKLAFNLA
ncbi:glycoside hydrolase family 113 [Liquorilactobacillus ghanensis]|uniref:glycoside hydrolase family 113 n=1 Tax=Liquorilactobacillus ghanensis TaxID=399370 RepID=UPI0039E9C7F8